MILANKKTRVKRREKRVKVTMARCLCNLNNNGNSDRKLELGMGVQFRSVHRWNVQNYTLLASEFEFFVAYLCVWFLLRLDGRWSRNFRSWSLWVHRKERELCLWRITTVTMLCWLAGGLPWKSTTEKQLHVGLSSVCLSVIFSGRTRISWTRGYQSQDIFRHS